MTTELSNDLSYPEKMEKVKANMVVFGKAQPGVMAAFGQLHKAGSVDGALDEKHKELIALAIGVATRCDDCIAFHTYAALKAGASRAEIMDMLAVTILMGGGPSMMYSTHVIEAMDQFEKKIAG